MGEEIGKGKGDIYNFNILLNLQPSSIPSSSRGYGRDCSSPDYTADLLLADWDGHYAWLCYRETEGNWVELPIVLGRARSSRGSRGACLVTSIDQQCNSAPLFIFACLGAALEF
jgi:hypothetical protein